MERVVNKHVVSDDRKVRSARLFRNGRSQAVRIPKEFEFAGNAVEIYKQPNGDLVLRQKGQTIGLIELLASLEPLSEADRFPEIDDSDMLPLKEVNL